MNHTGWMLILLATGCSSPVAATWDGTVQTWGAMRDVMRDGHTEGRVELSGALAADDAVGVGALEGLAGEVTVLDGEVWISQVDGQEPVTLRDPGDPHRATLMASARVPAWSSVRCDRDVAAGEVDAFLRECGVRAGLDPGQPFPVVVDGELTDLDLHVIAGQCPMRAEMQEEPLETPPYRHSAGRIRGILVGFYAEDSAGQLTHMGARTHLHVILRDPGLTGHVDRVGIASGSTVRVPVGSDGGLLGDGTHDAGTR